MRNQKPELASQFRFDRTPIIGVIDNAYIYYNRNNYSY